MSLPEGTSKFKEIERKVQGICFQLGREALARILEDWDKEIMHGRDKGIYRHVGKKRTTIKTVIGEVEYQRAQYEYISAEGVKSYVYLLDEAMGIGGGGLFSELMRELIVESCCASPYREAARTIRDMTGQTISHMAAWSVVQAVGEQVGEEERRAAEKAAKSEGAGTIEAKVVFEEQDGISLSLQGKSRKEHGERKEMKVAIAYDGAVKKGKERYILTNKVAYASFEGVDEFEKRKEGVIASVYNVDEVIMRFLNGDGANWIRRSQTDETVHFQLDPFHRNKAVTECVTNGEARETIVEARRTMDIVLLLHVIEVEAASTDDEKEREGYLKLYSYYNNNRDGLVPYYRRGLDIPDPPEGKEYRRMGAMESNVYTLIGNRMKGGRANWSIDGGNNLARLLCRKHTGRLRGVLDSLSAAALPGRYAEEVAVVMSAAKSPQREGKGYDGFHQAMIPSTQKWLKSIAAIKPVYSI
jgi:hypothetical protein